MKKYLIYALGLVLIAAASLLAFDAICVALVKQSQGTTMYKMYRLFANHHADEIPIFGSSRAAANFVPSCIGGKVFCYGIDGSDMRETMAHVEHYVRTRTGSDIIIINLDPWGFPLAHNDLGFSADYTMATNSDNGTSLKGVRMIGKLRGIVAAWVNQRVATTKLIDNGAILQLLSRTPEEWSFIEKSIEKKSFYVDEQWRQRIKGLTARNRYEIIWVVGPCAKFWKRHFSNKQGLDALCQWIDSLPRQRVLNYYDEEYDDKYFVDLTHLNAIGAREFSNQLRKDLNLTM